MVWEFHTRDVAEYSLAHSMPFALRHSPIWARQAGYQSVHSKSFTLKIGTDAAISSGDNTTASSRTEQNLVLWGS
ncbi:hypothetical protein EMPG_09377 [Blastomyces silverae]|uniref:Uncharacterized protein n=1 Tax=Blastomyces silverae TaxID=2060906 RepID=A0A0H1BXB9_9EURO|nr:hypothetical protein EMPG_09377 [Blastomyces silverae]